MSPVGDAGRSWKRCLTRPFGRRDGPESEASAVPPWPGLPVGDWIALLAYRLGIWAGPGAVRCSQRRLLDRAFAGEAGPRGTSDL